MAKERGGRDVEVARHRQFRHLLAHRNEWFRAEQELLDFAAGIEVGSA